MRNAPGWGVGVHGGQGGTWAHSLREFAALACARASTAHWAVEPSQGSSPGTFPEHENSPGAGAEVFMVVRGGLEPSARGFSVIEVSETA